MFPNIDDYRKLSLTLLYMLHKLISSPHSERDLLRVRAGHVLTDLGWPIKIQEDLQNDKYKWDETVDLQGFIK